ncbi:MAG TPA: cardiolipin synthase [Nevskiaceae bacterium]|nr:cardiolipin synthase [Nevskiaceae bacterium]
MATVRSTTMLAVLMALGLASGCATSEHHVREDLKHQYNSDDPQFQRTIGSLLGTSLVDGNKVTALHNGDEIFPAMLDAIAHARKTIDFETYIYWSGEIGRKVADALSERARNGVRVHVLLDWVGSDRIDHAVLRSMQQAGVEVERYHKPPWFRWFHWRTFNNRTHRKLLVVDGRIGFTGGVGIADQWTGHAQDEKHWRDSHYRVEGPVVAEMQSVFMDNWLQSTGKVLHGDDYFPKLEPVGHSRAQMFASSPTGGAESMKLMFLLAITAAKHSIYLSNSYFVPDPLARGALVAAVKRGVKVQIITPGKYNDEKTIRKASRARLGDLLKEGIEVYEYQPTMFHRKAMVIDERFVSVGSANFDARSFGLNDEANLNVFDEDFARREIEDFRNDLQRSKQLTYDEWKKRPFPEKFVERFFSLFGSAM